MTWRQMRAIIYFWFYKYLPPRSKYNQVRIFLFHTPLIKERASKYETA